MKLRSLIDDYMQALVIEKNYSQATIRNYDLYLTRFLEHVGDVDLKTITRESVLDYRSWLDKQPMSKTTQSYHLIALRSLLRHGAEQGINVVNHAVIVLPRLVRPTVDFLDQTEILALLDQPNTDTVLGLRDRAILEMLFATGLRLHELTALDRYMINLSTREFSIVGKGSKRRLVFLTERAAEWIRRYLNKREDTEPALFVSETHGETGRLSDRGIQRIVKRYADEAHITKHVSPHTLRHSMATNILSHGGDIRVVQELLGHSSIMTTQIYTHVTSPRMKSIHDQMHTLDDVK